MLALKNIKIIHRLKFGWNLFGLEPFGVHWISHVGPKKKVIGTQRGPVYCDHFYSAIITYSCRFRVKTLRSPFMTLQYNNVKSILHYFNRTDRILFQTVFRIRRWLSRGRDGCSAADLAYKSI